MGKHVEGLNGQHSAGNKGRHRAENLADPANTGPIARQGGGYKSKVAHAVIAAGTLALVTASASPGQANRPQRHVSAKQETEQLPVVAAPGAHVAFDKVHVATEPAPPPQIVQEVPEPIKIIAPRNPAPAKLPAVSAPKPVPPPPAAPPRVVPLPPPPVAQSAVGAAIAAAALAQLGRRQDCTKLVTNSLAAVGIQHHGWPVSYLALGTRVSDPQPGDLIYYVNGGMGLAHIAVYIGNGLAVHGGWNGFQTVTFKANVGSGPVYIRVRT